MEEILNKYDVVKEIINDDNFYHIAELANDEEVRKNDCILFGSEYHIRKLAPYVKKHGYEVIQDIVRDFYGTGNIDH